MCVFNKITFAYYDATFKFAYDSTTLSSKWPFIHVYFFYFISKEQFYV